MRNLKKLSRSELKIISGGAGPYEEFAMDPIDCHYHYTESANGTQNITYVGSGDCHNRLDGSKCYSYVAMGGSCY